MKCDLLIFSFEDKEMTDIYLDYILMNLLDVGGLKQGYVVVEF